MSKYVNNSKMLWGRNKCKRWNVGHKIQEMYLKLGLIRFGAKNSVILVGNFAVWNNLREQAFVFCSGSDCKVSMTRKLAKSLRLNDGMLLLIVGTTFSTLC